MFCFLLSMQKTTTTCEPIYPPSACANAKHYGWYKDSPNEETWGLKRKAGMGGWIPKNCSLRPFPHALSISSFGGELLQILHTSPGHDNSWLNFQGWQCWTDKKKEHPFPFRKGRETEAQRVGFVLCHLARLVLAERAKGPELTSPSPAQAPNFSDWLPAKFSFSEDTDEVHTGNISMS